MVFITPHPLWRAGAVSSQVARGSHPWGCSWPLGREGRWDRLSWPPPGHASPWGDVARAGLGAQGRCRGAAGMLPALPGIPLAMIGA